MQILVTLAPLSSALYVSLGRPGPLCKPKSGTVPREAAGATLKSPCLHLFSKKLKPWAACFPIIFYKVV